MYLLYLDESGNEDDPADKHFVLGGAAVFERQTFFLSQALDGVQTRHFPGLQPIEFHASAIRAGRGFWRDIEQQKKDEVLQDIPRIIGQASPEVILFAAVIEKSNRLWGEAAVEHATEEVCNRFDIFLKRLYQESGYKDAQRGLLIFSEGRFDKRAKVWVRGFRELGTRWGILRNLSDIPYFAGMRETRLLQIADFISHAVFLLYERRDPSLMRPFIHRFNRQEGILHGLVHSRSDIRTACDCPACHSRANPGGLGSWV